ncbi:MAG: hypothetical protein QOK37_4338 [Thermoanaerobaculia bacterium]|jgi:uncharacterized NAD(P)/FAD-binding protein YdhS|nr:hypothetical protein [Thermoanaerobaculia bacterium]
MLDYDFIMNGDWPHRVRLFASLPAEEKAEFVRTHRRRWLNANRHRLSAEQAAAIEEEIAFIVPDLYQLPRDPALDQAAKALESNALKLFTRRDLYQLTLHGEQVPAV